MSDLEFACVAALASLPGMGPVGLRTALADVGAREAWSEVLDGRRVRPPSLRGGGGPAWASEAARLDLEAMAARMAAHRIGTTWAGRADWPSSLAADPAPPGALFWRGDLTSLDQPCVAVVGTRRATPEGRRIATELGRDLADAGVCVVSGLALGIDGAAHRGAIDARRGRATVGVAASGVDVAYPPRHRDLWEEVVAAGAVVAETPPGRPAQGWRFPARNRIIAGLVRLVVVVESHARGGSLLTADAAIERGVDVRVVPGPVSSPASAGTNQLLWDGPGPVRDATDVLDVLGSFRSPPPPRPRRVRPAPPPPAAPRLPLGQADARSAGPPLESAGRAVLEAVGYRPTSLNQVVAGAGRPVAAVCALLDDLAEAGLVVEAHGWWQRR